MMDRGYPALRQGAAWFELAGRGKIVAGGEDRARLLHALTTNHIQQLAPGQGCYAFFLNAQGRILSDVRLLVGQDELSLDVEPAFRERVYQHVDRYIIADDVTLADRSGALTTIAVEGPGAGAVLEAAGLPVPEAACSWQEAGGGPGDSSPREVVVARLSYLGGPGWWLVAAPALRDGLVRRLEQAGGVEAGAQAVETVRLEHGRPLYGVDFSEANIPQETQLMDALNFNKGCYLGQEIVERVRSRGHVNRLLVPLEIASETEAAQVVERGAKVASEGKDAGVVTSAAFSPALGAWVALALLRAEFARAGAPLEVAGARARLRPRPQ